MSEGFKVVEDRLFPTADKAIDFYMKRSKVTDNPISVYKKNGDL